MQIVRLAFANAASDCAQQMSAATITYLVLMKVGVAGTSLVQGAPLLATCLAAPLVGLLIDQKPVGQGLAPLLLLLAARSLGFLWFDWRLYAGLLLVDVVAQPALSSAYAGLLPALATGHDISRVSGLCSALTNLGRALGVVLGPLLAYHGETLAFLGVAAMYGGAALLALTLPHSVVPTAPVEPMRMSARHLATELGAGMRRLLAEREDRMVLGFLALAGLCWGVGDVVALRVAEEGLGVPSQWTGFYLSAALVAEVVGGLLVGIGVIDGAKDVPRKVAFSVLGIGLTFMGAGLVRAPLAGFGLKIVEGLLSVFVGLLCWIALVLRKHGSVRGRLAGLFAALWGLPHLLGKALAYGSAGRCSVRELCAATGFGVSVLAAFFLLLEMRNMKCRPRSNV